MKEQSFPWKCLQVRGLQGNNKYMKGLDIWENLNIEMPKEVPISEYPNYTIKGQPW
jgi:hypothetical protein